METALELFIDPVDLLPKCGDNFDRVGVGLFGYPQTDSAFAIDPELAPYLLKRIHDLPQVAHVDGSATTVGHYGASQVVQILELTRGPNDDLSLIVQHVSGGDVPILPSQSPAHVLCADTQRRQPPGIQPHLDLSNPSPSDLDRCHPFYSL